MDIHWLAIINSFVLMLLILPGPERRHLKGDGSKGELC
jgi:hypothetical protein